MKSAMSEPFSLFAVLPAESDVVYVLPDKCEQHDVWWQQFLRAHGSTSEQRYERARNRRQVVLRQGPQTVSCAKDSELSYIHAIWRKCIFVRSALGHCRNSAHKIKPSGFLRCAILRSVTLLYAVLRSSKPPLRSRPQDRERPQESLSKTHI